MKPDNAKELLIDVTISLINEHNGDVSRVTIRDITTKSGVAVGLINYHFGNKDNLISCCVQKIIRQVITSFTPKIDIDESLDNYHKVIQRLICVAKQVFEFLFANKSIARISILNDYSNYTDTCNSNMSVKGFMTLLNGLEVKELEKERIAFYLTNSMQIAFLRTINTNNYLGYDFTKEESRNKYIEDLVNTILGGK